MREHLLFFIRELFFRLHDLEMTWNCPINDQNPPIREHFSRHRELEMTLICLDNTQKPPTRERFPRVSG